MTLIERPVLATKRLLRRSELLRRLRQRQYLLSLGLQFEIFRFAGWFPSRTLRHGIYQAFGMKLAPGACVHRGAEVRGAAGIVIGSGTIIGFDAILDGRAGITLGSNVNLSSEVAMWTAQHDPNDPDFEVKGGPIVISDRAWLSFRCTILPGVHVGEGAVVAAGAVVAHDVPPYTIVAGIPAKVIGERERNLRYDLASSGKPPFI